MASKSSHVTDIRNWLKLENLEDRTTPSASISVDPTAYAADHVLVTLSRGIDHQALLSRISRSPVTTGIERLGFDVYKVSIKSGVDVGLAVTHYSGANGIQLVERDYVLRATATPNDASFSSQWALNQSNDADIDAPEAWDIARGTGAKVVAVIDTGVDYTHPDLNANMWRNPGETAGDGIDNDGNGWVDDVYGADFANGDGNPMDDHGHGTHVAGTIGAVGNNGVGVTGVAWTTRIMALKFMTSSGSGSTSNAVRAINYAVANGAKILNNSWGGGGYSSTLNNAIVNARNAGVIFVAAAGNNASNNDSTPYYPSGYAVDNVVSVAATTGTDGLASFSNYGANTVTLGAPGSNILSTTRGGGYGYMSGTSMAAPHVAGALAAFWDANPSMTYQQVIQRLKNTVDPLASLAGRTVTGGRLNLSSLLNSTSPPVSPPPVSPPPPTPAQLSGYVFEDADNDGVMDAGEAPIAGVSITLFQVVNGVPMTIGTTTTGSDGRYLFSNIAPGSGYRIVEAQPSAYLDGLDTPGSTGGWSTINDQIDGITLISGANSVNNNFGELLPPPVSPPPVSPPPISPPPVSPPPVSPPPISPPPVSPPPTWIPPGKAKKM